MSRTLSVAIKKDVPYRSPCHVVYTDFRPTPLQHYIYPSGADGLYMVVDENSNFKNDSFQKAIAALSDAQNNASAAKQKAKGKKGPKQPGDAEESDIFKIVKMIMERQYDPVTLHPSIQSSTRRFCHVACT